MMRKLIAIAGKRNSGKDTVGDIILLLTSYQQNFDSDEAVKFLNSKKNYFLNTFWDKRKFSFFPDLIYTVITGIPFSALSRKEKEKERPKFIEFVEREKTYFGKDVWAKALFNQILHPEEKLLMSNTIITDLRFPEEANLIRKHNGIMIKVIRPDKERLGYNEYNADPTETALDNYGGFKYVISNSGTLEDLVEDVRGILIKENIIAK